MPGKNLKSVLLYQYHALLSTLLSTHEIDLFWHLPTQTAGNEVFVMLSAFFGELDEPLE
jgi:hypothetical protein